MIEKRIYIFSRKTTLNVWNCRMQILQPRRRTFIKSLKKAHQCSHWQKLQFFQKNNFTNVFLSTRRGRFHNPTEKVPAKSGNDLHQSPVLIFLQFLQTKVLKYSICTPKIYFWQPNPGNFTRKAAKLFLETIFTQKPPLDMLIEDMTNDWKFSDWMTKCFSSTSKNEIILCLEISEIVGKQKQKTCSCFFPKSFSGNRETILENSGKRLKTLL